MAPGERPNTFRKICVFDVSQTEGKPLPEKDSRELTENVSNYQVFWKALCIASPVPVSFEAMKGKKGYFSSTEQRIAINTGMGQLQNCEVLVHEIAHAVLHNSQLANYVQKTKEQKEVEAESVAFVVCLNFGLDTSDCSMGYIHAWGQNQGIALFNNSMNIIQATSCKIIDKIRDALLSLDSGAAVKGNQHKQNADSQNIKISVEELKKLLSGKNIVYIDNRHKKGALWVIGGPELAPVLERCEGVKFKFKADGGRAVGIQPAWWGK